MVLGKLFTKPTDEQIKKDLEKKRDAMIQKSGRLRKLTASDDSGWVEYVTLIQEYIEACKKRKALTPLDRADEKTIREIQLLDHEIHILTWCLKVPAQYIAKVQEILKKEDEKNEPE